MKIIGEGREHFIIEVTRRELANLTGYYSEYSYEKDPYPKVGDTIAVHAMYQRLYTLSRRRGEIKTAQKMLRDAASELELVAPILEATDEEKPSV